jgi:LysR family glycine cleavage system transcriptional activator
MPRRLPPLNAMRAFEAVARNGSVTAAARELSVTQGAVSRHVATLEQWLGAKLLTRTPRGVEITARGLPYFRTLRRALDQIDSATRRLRKNREENLLRLKLPPTFAIRWLVPRLARFHALHPQFAVQITTSHETADFEREEVDAYIHSEREPPSGAGIKRLFGETLLPVCSPGLLKRGPPLRRPRDLAKHVLLCSLNRPHDWPAWLAAAKAPNIDGNEGVKFENAALAYQAAIDELGVMIAQRALVEDHLRSGRLIAPIALAVPTPGAYYLAYSTSRARPPRLAAFEAWIVGEARKVEEG